MTSKNKLMIASAGAGKTTYLVKKALDIINNEVNDAVLITTYTRSNAEQIRVKIKEENLRKNGHYSIPNGITVQEWFTFLLREGVRPFKSLMESRLKYKSIGIFPDFQFNKNRYKSETNVLEHYFVNYKIVPNSLSKFVCKVNERNDNEVVNRLSNIYSYIFIDEIQDLAGYDLDLIHEMFKSPINVLLVGDPRQITYLTNQPQQNRQYKYGKIEQFIKDKCNKVNVDIDKITLKESHRNNEEICSFSSKLYPLFEKSIPCKCTKCRGPREFKGIFVVRESDVKKCKEKFKHEDIGTLRWQKAIHPEKNYGDSKGLTYDRVIIYPTKPIVKYLKEGNLKKEVKSKNGEIVEKDAFSIARFYVAITRARTSAFIVYNFKEDETFIEGVQKFIDF